MERCCRPLTEDQISVNDAADLASKLKALAEPMRLRIVNLIAANEEICVCDLTAPLGLTQPTISHHLKVLTEAGLVTREQRGKWAYYGLDTDAFSDVASALAPSVPAAV